MEVLLLNGSPNEKGCTCTAPSEMARALEKEGTEAEITHIKKNCIMGCIGCGVCSSNENRCISDGGIINEALGKMETADGLIVGSPAYFALPIGTVLFLFDRIFMARNKFYLEPAVAVAFVRRTGAIATIDVLNKYFNPVGMPTVSSNYYNVIYGYTPEETRQDEEGMQTTRTFGRNMAWMLKCMEASREESFVMPEKEPKIKTSYIRQITRFGCRAKHCLKCCGQKM